jgi:hypothetical protein
MCGLFTSKAFPHWSLAVTHPVLTALGLRDIESGTFLGNDTCRRPRMPASWNR